jgi:RNA polymerase sigma-70 factor (ECF subfamily)
MDLLLALESLSKEQQQAFLLKEEGFSRREIAVMTDSNEETIKSRILYASNHLKRILEVQYAE